ncbi:hypothetical protein G7Y79_00012g033040 [Physcia stellaris]|nr:hypothetical protein G7Y79_00012g033040 [Physcia stellaris]
MAALQQPLSPACSAAYAAYKSAYAQQTPLIAMVRAYPLFASYCKQLGLPDSVMVQAVDLYQRAYCAELKPMTSSRHSRLFIACIFLCCRQAEILQSFSEMVAKLDSLVNDSLVKKTLFKETLEAIDYLENFIDGIKLEDDPIVVSWRPSTDGAALETSGASLGEVKLTWSGGSVAFLVGRYNTKCPKLRDMRLQRVGKAEDGVEAKHEFKD